VNKIKPIKRLGQNFLINKKIIKKVINTANLKPQDTVLEIGPGMAALTQELIKKAKVIAIEKDYRLYQILQQRFRDFKNIEIINQDALKYDPKIKNYKIVANLPFYITAPVIRKFLEIKNQPKEMVLIIQKEVAQRICAKPPDMNILALSVQIYSKPEIISYISKRSFSPVPKVDSAIIKITPHKNYRINKDDFFKIIKAGFSHPRKQLANNLAKGLKLNKEEINSLLKKNNINPKARAESLSINDWLQLIKSGIIF